MKVEDGFHRLILGGGDVHVGCSMCEVLCGCRMCFVSEDGDTCAGATEYACLCVQLYGHAFSRLISCGHTLSCHSTFDWSLRYTAM